MLASLSLKICVTHTDEEDRIAGAFKRAGQQVLHDSTENLKRDETAASGVFSESWARIADADGRLPPGRGGEGEAVAGPASDAGDPSQSSQLGEASGEEGAAAEKSVVEAQQLLDISNRLEEKQRMWQEQQGESGGRGWGRG